MQLATGAGAPQISQLMPVTPQAIRTIARGYLHGGLEPAQCEKQHAGAAAVLDDGRSSGLSLWL